MSNPHNRRRAAQERRRPRWIDNLRKPTTTLFFMALASMSSPTGTLAVTPTQSFRLAGLGATDAQTFRLGLLRADSEARVALRGETAERALATAIGSDVVRRGADELEVDTTFPDELTEQERIEARPGLVSVPARFTADLWDLARSPLRMNRRHVRNLGLGLAAIGAASLLDERLRVTASSAGAREVAERVRPLAQELGLGALGASWLVSRSFDRPALQAATGDAIEAVVLTGLVVTAVKELSGRARPRTGLGADRWGGSGSSFASGETSVAVAIASVFAYHSDRWWGDALAWTYAATIGWERMQLDAHWASDVVAGALIGHSIARWTTRRNQRNREGARWAAYPQLAQGSYAAFVNVGF